MANEIQTELLIPEQVYGSSTCTVTVHVTNTSGKPLDKVSVEPIIVCGKLLSPGSNAEESTTSELLALRRRIINEMERQVVRAYERNRIRRMSFSEKATYAYVSAINTYISLFTIGLSRTGIPPWANEALKIQEWEDVERLETDVISKEDEDSFLRKAFQINRDKLRRCLDRITSESSKPEPLNPGDTLSPSTSLSYPFTIRLPHLLRSKDLDLEFRVSYSCVEDNQFIQRSIGKRITIRPSAFAVPTGGMIGAACGYGIRTTLKATVTEPFAFDWLTFGGSILLGLVFTLLTARRPQGKQVITAEDFVGGFIIGALTGLFSEEVLKKLALVIK
jgi:hypothetical protein